MDRAFRDRLLPSSPLLAVLVESIPQLEFVLPHQLNQFYSTPPYRHKPTDLQTTPAKAFRVPNFHLLVAALTPPLDR